MKAIVYTLVYSPFRFGLPWHPGKATIEVESLVDIGGGYKGYVFQSSKSKWHVAEKETGALIGHAKTRSGVVKLVKKDIKEADPKVMRKQIKDAKEQVKSATEIDADEFINRLANHAQN